MPRNLSTDEISDFRDRLCDAAERMFAEQGPAAVTIRQLAAAVGVSAMTPYRYFEDKNAILAAVRARAFDRHAQTLERAYYDSPPHARAAAIAEAYIAWALENPAAYKLMFDINQPDEQAYPELVRAGERSRRTMMLHLADELAAGRVRGDPLLIAHMYWSALHGSLMLRFSGMLSASLDVRTLITTTLVALDRGLLNEGRPRDYADAAAGQGLSRLC